MTLKRHDDRAEPIVFVAESGDLRSMRRSLSDQRAPALLRDRSGGCRRSHRLMHDASVIDRQIPRAMILATWPLEKDTTLNMQHLYGTATTDRTTRLRADAAGLV